MTSADIEIVKGRLDEDEMAALVVVLMNAGRARDGEDGGDRPAEAAAAPRWDAEGLSPPRPASAPRPPRTR